MALLSKILVAGLLGHLLLTLDELVLSVVDLAQIVYEQLLDHSASLCLAARE
jgi:hypothetical protein